MYYFQVFWPELGCRYGGTVSKINDDSSYDISYEESVDGKPCFEKKVSADRIEGDEDYFHEVSEGTGDDKSTTSKDDYVKPVSGNRPIVQQMLKVCDIPDSSDDVSHRFILSD